jgi:hypothetical protein
MDPEAVTAAIGNGEFPGNHLGPHWRVDRAAVVRWLQGSYQQPPPALDPAGSPEIP